MTAIAELTIHDDASTQSSLASYLGPKTVKKILSVAPVNTATLSLLNSVNSGMLLLPENKELVTRVIRAENWFGHYVKKAATSSRKIVLYLHGGAFVSGGYGTHKRLIESIVMHSSAAVFAVSYRQFPHATFNESIEDCISAFYEVVGMGYDPENITLVGDSAGGALAVKVAAALIEQDIKFNKIATFSGWFDFSLTPENYGIFGTKDAYLPPARISQLAKIVVGRDLLESDSPIFDVNEKFPEMLLICGSNEALRVDTELMKEKCLNLGVPTETHIFKNGIHAFPIGVGVFPEAKAAVSILSDFI